MRRQTPAVILSLLISHAGMAQFEVPARVTFVVRDQDGRPVSKAKVEGWFGDVSQAGAHDLFDGFTRTNGLLVARGKAGLKGVGGEFTKPGYYATQMKWPLSKDQCLKMKRWDVEIPVLLKRKVNPIPMHVRHVSIPGLSPYAPPGKLQLDKMTRYDLVKGAFLPPQGNGEIADIEVMWKVRMIARSQDGFPVDFDTSSEIRLTNCVDGICRGKPDGGENGYNGSCYISAYDAPADGYTNAVSLYRNVRGRKVDANDDRHYLWYLRIRTQTNEMGQVTNALYGKIYGQINGNFACFLNLTSNDRNVEEKRE